MKPRTDCIRSEWKGYREVLWCWIRNEPSILNWSYANRPCCSECDWEDTDYNAEDGTLSTAFLTRHTWICGIDKPRGEE